MPHWDSAHLSGPSEGLGAKANAQSSFFSSLPFPFPFGGLSASSASAQRQGQCYLGLMANGLSVKLARLFHLSLAAKSRSCFSRQFRLKPRPTALGGPITQRYLTLPGQNFMPQSPVLLLHPGARLAHSSSCHKQLPHFGGMEKEELGVQRKISLHSYWQGPLPLALHWGHHSGDDAKYFVSSSSSVVCIVWQDAFMTNRCQDWLRKRVHLSKYLKCGTCSS